MRYPTDEELSSLIENLEAEPLFAPPHLKGNIMAEIDKITLPASGKRLRWWQGNSAYNMKVIAGMAAALILIFTLPLDVGPRIGMEETSFAAEQAETESEIEKFFRISTTAINETNRIILDKLNIFDGLFNRN
ncbi:MAG: hypothetical protein FWG91_11260 [Lachnospiraceae bacterium]|nr:hypothetical protein [Lachnospiraceae bacterium]